MRRVSRARSPVPVGCFLEGADRMGKGLAKFGGSHSTMPDLLRLAWLVYEDGAGMISCRLSPAFAGMETAEEGARSFLPAPE